MFNNDFLFRSGDLFLSGKIKDFLDYYHIGNDESLFYINNWSIVHFLSGVLIAFIFIFYTKKTKYEIIFYCFILHSIWEIWQVYVKNTNIYTPRGIIDIVVDTLLFMIGVFIVCYNIYSKV